MSITQNGNAFKTWDDVEQELFTPEEIAESELRVALIGEIIKARQAKGLTQQQLGELAGVKQPVIARMEKGSTSPQLSTVLKVLTPLGMKLAIVPIDDKKHA
ncbi:MAG: helix-turn-helix domain-containing protein [Oscillospiraceae bacterium]|nr:helix-turn-helix domain-containing protein [Oscillospiraceae bacterium]